MILVVREFDKFSELLGENGFEVVNFEAIRTFPLDDFKLENLENYDGLFFTSPKAAEVFLKKIEKNAFRGKVYVLGNRTKKLFKKSGFQIVFRDEANTAEDLINSFESAEFAGKKFLFLRGDKSLRTIPELLKNVAAIDEIIVYRTIENSIDEDFFVEIGEKIRSGEINRICLFSPSGVESFVKKFGEASLNKVKIAAIGATTARKAIEKNLKVDFISPRANAEDFARELINYIKKIE